MDTFGVNVFADQQRPKEGGFGALAPAAAVRDHLGFLVGKSIKLLPGATQSCPGFLVSFDLCLIWSNQS